jgi:hypothetical protein
MASTNFTNLLNGVKEQLIPKFFRTNTNINPHHRVSVPRLRHFGRVPKRKLRLPQGMYSDKELALQSTAVSNYHAAQDQRKQRQTNNRLHKLNRQFAIQARKEHKANKPIIVED